MNNKVSWTAFDVEGRTVQVSRIRASHRGPQVEIRTYDRDNKANRYILLTDAQVRALVGTLTDWLQHTTPDKEL